MKNIKDRIKNKIKNEWFKRKQIAQKRVQEKTFGFQDKFEFIKEFKEDHPRLFKFGLIGVIIAILTTGFHGYIFVTRLPNAIDCSLSSVYTKEIPFENWKFNWYSKTYQTQCRYFNGKIWIDQDKVIDVGQSTDLDDIEM